MPTPTTEQPEQTSAAPHSPTPIATSRPAITEQTRAVAPLAIQRDANTIPLAGVCIPDLPRGRGGWRIALRQWYDIDPKTGYALKNWPDAWFKESMRAKTAAKRSQRALIAHEYESLGGTDGAFLASYPAANTMRISDLLGAIRGKYGRRRKSRNGTPEQRYNSQSSELASTTPTSESGIENADECMPL